MLVNERYYQQSRIEWSWFAVDSEEGGLGLHCCGSVGVLRVSDTLKTATVTNKINLDFGFSQLGSWVEHLILVTLKLYILKCQIRVGHILHIFIGHIL